MILRLGLVLVKLRSVEDFKRECERESWICKQMLKTQKWRCNKVRCRLNKYKLIAYWNCGVLKTGNHCLIHYGKVSWTENLKKVFVEVPMKSTEIFVWSFLKGREKVRCENVETSQGECTLKKMKDSQA